ncbi:M16 family metallopeptidase [Snuella sedimenti]|uniref:Insulinase family protein n=1 Tax=Snuella sedimenti TaxID=2798802 RepID=A0A8J7IV05_9FLAO|nr:M16 family metallopeptidase [Snuella sedimenti]MBJ6367285.1 insulinase family protein [Snuella sedimenti]
MKKTVTVLAFLVLGLYNGLSQTINLNDKLPTDTKIKKGVLPNGMTYYIQNTDVVKDAASYYIIQNVGSVLENDEQQGLAHFLEHMAFNGTENFEGKGILNTLQKHGAVFGKDINAYTSFDETVYNMNNIPNTEELIDTCLLVLHDWSHYLLLTDEEIDAERGVIKEEWRTRQSGRMRILKKQLPVMFNNTIYANRMPIGLMDVVENFEYKALRDFYHDWYRTDLQAIAIVGDVDIDDIEQKIKDLFSDIPAVENPKERILVSIPDNDEMLYAMVMDEEVTTSQISFNIRHPRSLEDETVADLKESLLNSMVTSMLSARIKEVTQKPDAPFLGTWISYGKHSRTANAFSVTISPKPNNQHEAFKAALEEVNRAVKFGFTKEEVDRTIVQFKNYYENQIAKEDDRSHGTIVQTMQRNYLDNDAMIGIEDEYTIVKSLFETLSEDGVHKRIKDLYTKNNRFVTVIGVEGRNNLTKEEAARIIQDVENDANLEPYTDGFAGKTLISGVNITAGSIVSEDKNEAIGSTTYKLSNGITVHYKFADKNKNDVKLSAVSYGGLSLVEDEDLPSAEYTTTIAQKSGLGDYSAVDLSKVLAGKSASTSVGISNLSESISGSSVTKDVETMLQMVYLRFEKPRFDEDAFKVFQNQIDNYIIRKSKDINSKIADSVTVTLYGDKNPKHRLFTKEYANEINFDKIKTIYKQRFNNAADFEFFIVGDVQEEQLEPLLEQYIASIPTNKVVEKWQDNSVNWVSNTIDKDVYLTMEDPKSTVKIAYKNEIDYNLKNALLARALGDILKLRYTETLREEEGGTYGAGASAWVSKRPKEEAMIGIGFDCNPDKVEKLSTIAHNELKKIAQGVINQEDLDKTTTNYLKERKQQEGYNSYDMNVLTTFYREGYNINDPESFENIVKSITAEQLKAFTAKVLDNAKSYEIIIKPKE